MIGSKIGPYLVKRILGKGGMATVYEAENERIERRVAIKVLHADFASQTEFVSRFFNEARAVNRVAHPSIVQIHEHGELPDGTAYIVMEYLEGDTLSDRLAKAGGRLPVKTALQVAWQVAAALSAVHSKGIIHRDLKPSNLMLVQDPLGPGGERVKVLDFGIAKLAAAAHQKKTASRVVMGTPTYMSPEQCRGAGMVDEKSDVYSLGVILYELLAGQPPFDSDGLGEILGMHLFKPPQPLAERAPDVPIEVASFVDELLNKDRSQRPAMTAVHQQLSQLIATDWNLSPGKATQVQSLVTTASSAVSPPNPEPRTALSHSPPTLLAHFNAQVTRNPAPRRKLLGLTALLAAITMFGGTILWSSFNRATQVVEKDHVQTTIAEKPAAALAPKTSTAPAAISEQATPKSGTTDQLIASSPPSMPTQKGGQSSVPLGVAEGLDEGSMEEPSPSPGRHRKRQRGRSAILQPTDEAHNPTAQEQTTQEKATTHPEPIKAPEQQPVEARQALQRAALLVEQKQYDSALSFAQLALRGNLVSSWNVIGMAHCGKGDGARAQEAYEHADPQGQRRIAQFCQGFKIAISASKIQRNENVH